MGMPKAPVRPELTMPPEEAAWLRAAYESAEVILEYGSGGSTVMAAEMPGKLVWSVENDWKWANQMQDWFKANPPKAAAVRIHHTGIGPVSEWGLPVSHARWRRYAKYPLEVWSDPDFSDPDVVLVDGRFRVGCVLAALFEARKPLTLYFDDYVRRPRYHVIEEFVTPQETCGRMARFEITPRHPARGELLRVMELMQRPL